ncbi:MAG: ThuA domain-containing protein [Armatimonadetes bacterium]|nr:ThuA domain-containing protein [Armatimonadota bacterium]
MSPKPRKVLYFTRHTVYTIGALSAPLKPLEGPSFSDEVMMEIGRRSGFEVECSRNGEVLDGDLSQYGAFVFFTSGSWKMLMAPESTQGSPPVSPRGRERLYEALDAGAGFVALRNTVSCSEEIIGCSYNGHPPIQEGRMIVTSPHFPGLQGAGDSFSLRDQWYTHKQYSKDIHAILLQDTEWAKQVQVPPERRENQWLMERPPFPSTWARHRGESRVFYTTLGNYNETWSHPIFQGILQGAVCWALGMVDFDATPNIQEVAPLADQTHW